MPHTRDKMLKRSYQGHDLQKHKLKKTNKKIQKTKLRNTQNDITIHKKTNMNMQNALNFLEPYWLNYKNMKFGSNSS